MAVFVNTFERKLDCSRNEAVWRIIGLLIFSLAMVGVVATVFYYLPYRSSYEQHIQALPGNHEEVTAILDGEVLVGENRFLEHSQGRQTFIAVDDSKVSYMVKVGDISYRYDQIVGFDGVRYNSVGQEIRGGEVVRYLQRDQFNIIGLFALAPGFLLLLFELLARETTRKLFGQGDNWYYRSIFD